MYEYGVSMEFLIIYNIKLSKKYFNKQGCRSAFIFCGSGSSYFFNAYLDTDPALKIVLRITFFSGVEKDKKDQGSDTKLINFLKKI